MKKITIIPLLALVIASCGGGNNQTQSGAPSADTATTATTTEQPQASPDKERIAYNILNTIAEIKVDNFDKDAFNEIYWNGENDYYEHLELIFDEYAYFFDCFPLKNGGYYVLFQNQTFTYKDGKLVKGPNFLPKPSIDDFFADADKFPKDARDAIQKKVETASSAYYELDTEQLLMYVRIRSYDKEGNVSFPKALEKLIALDTYDDVPYDMRYPNVRYIWNGEQFVRDPENKPLEGFAKYLGVSEF